MKRTHEWSRDGTNETIRKPKRCLSLNALDSRIRNQKLMQFIFGAIFRIFLRFSFYVRSIGCAKNSKHWNRNGFLTDKQIKQIKRKSSNQHLMFWHFVLEQSKYIGMRINREFIVRTSFVLCSTEISWFIQLSHSAPHRIYTEVAICFCWCAFVCVFSCFLFSFSFSFFFSLYFCIVCFACMLKHCRWPCLLALPSTDVSEWRCWTKWTC